MIPRVKSVTPLPGLKIAVSFRDGAAGIVDIGRSLRLRGVLERLKDSAFFARVYVGRNSRTVTWPGQLDLDPVMLYHRATGKSIEWIFDQDEPVKTARKRANHVVAQSPQE